VTGRIVVGIDGSPNSTAAARWAVAEARLRSAELEILTVFAALSLPDLPERPRVVSDQQVADACARMQHEQLAGIPDRDVPVLTRTLRGDPAQALVEASVDADLLVVGARGHGSFADLLLGSVSLGCVHNAACPVTVVPAYTADAPPGAPVVVGVDGSPAGDRALKVAAEEAALRGTHVRAVHAVHWSSTGADLVRPSRDELVDWGAMLLDGALAPVEAEWPDLRFERSIVPGHAVQVLDAAARESALLVVGSRGRGRLAGRLLGSVSLHLVSHAHGPTTVVGPHRATTSRRSASPEGTAAR
jgi:nucleotide-binding universal stress UspA family protein